MEKLVLAVIFGGQSSEHEISCLSATNIIQCINKDKYEVVMIGITKEGHWVHCQSLEALQDGSWRNSPVTAVLSPDATKQCVYFMNGSDIEEVKLDVIFPVLHGLYGEDGTVQGIFELSRIPYVGCGVLASAVSMDKLYTKIIVDTLHIRQAEYVAVHKNELGEMKHVLDRVERKLDYPVFVKPSCAGSSKGVSKAENRSELSAALELAAQHDSKILVEETIVGREIECAVLGGEKVKASGVGEIVAAADFYDFDAKYNNAESITNVSPILPAGVEEDVRNAAVRIFTAVNGCGLSRVDFFLTDKEIVFNEINTLPGFTAISMYPMLWEKQGIDKKTLVQKIIDTAFMRDEH